MKIKVITVLERLPDKSGTNKTTGRPYTIRSARVLATVDGASHEIKVSSFHPLEIGDGAEIEVNRREYTTRDGTKLVEYEVARQAYSGGKGSFGGGNKKPSYTLEELDALFAHASEQAKKYVPDVTTPQGAELYQKLVSTYIIAATDTGAKVGGNTVAPASGNGSSKAAAQTLFDATDWKGQEPKKAHIEKLIKGETKDVEEAIRLMNTWNLPQTVAVAEKE